MCRKGVWWRKGLGGEEEERKQKEREKVIFQDFVKEVEWGWM